jgi:holliday junction DNA helicase RuvB
MLIGNENTKKQISVAMESAKQRNMSLPHILMSGHPGCGKTSTAREIASDLGADLVSLIPETLKDQRSILNLLDSLNFSGYDDSGNRVGRIQPTIVFIDECHRLPIFGQEKLGIIMENFTIDTGKAGKVYWVPYFTVIGASTLTGSLSKPFVDRFKVNLFFETYSLEESIQIVAHHAKRLKVIITKPACVDIATRSKGIPRIIVRHLERCRDMMLATGAEIITSNLTLETFKNLEIDSKGFNKIELKVLKILYDYDKPLSLENLIMVTGESRQSLQNDIESFLIKNGLVVRSGKGRLITPQGRLYLEEQGYVGNGQGRKTIPVDYARV